MAARSKRRRRGFPIFGTLLLLVALFIGAMAIRSRTRADRLSIANMGFFLDQGITGFAVYNQNDGMASIDGSWTAEASDERGHRTWRHSPGWYWLWWKWGPDNVSRFTAMFPVWPIPLLLGIGSAGLFIRWLRRIRTGCCLKCGYDLREIAAEAPCPECGHKSKPAAALLPTPSSPAPPSTP